MAETTDSPQQAANAKTTWAVLIAIILVVSFGLYSAFGGGGGTKLGAEETETRLETAQALLHRGPRKYIQVRDDGYTLIVDGKGNDSPGANLDAIVIVLMALDMPDSVISKMDNTRALDGMQEATWDNLTATWTYHPDDGLDIIIEDSAR